jgi:hypothetical protein
MGAAARRKAGLPAEFDAEVFGTMHALIRVEEALLAHAGGGDGAREEAEVPPSKRTELRARLEKTRSRRMNRWVRSRRMRRETRMVVGRMRRKCRQMLAMLLQISSVILNHCYFQFVWFVIMIIWSCRLCGTNVILTRIFVVHGQYGLILPVNRFLNQVIYR